MSTLKVGIFHASVRPRSNNAGICEWVKANLISSAPSPNSPQTLCELEVVDIYLNRYPLPLGPYQEDYMTQAIRPITGPEADTNDTNADVEGSAQTRSTPRTKPKQYDYPSQRTRDFSNLIGSLHALIIVTPQYNWGYPGELKNAIDALYFEWNELPIMTVNYGGRGGNFCAQALELVLKGIHAQIVSCGQMLISLPRDQYIVGDDRVKGDEEWLKAHDIKLKEELGKLYRAAEKCRIAKGADP